MTVLHGISSEELAGRRDRLLEQIRQDGSTGYVLFDDKYIQYFTGFGFLSTERPVVFAQSAGGEMVVFVPEFEVARVRAETALERVESYPEYPGIEHPMLILARVLGDLGIQGAVRADQDGYPGILGYQGPALSAATAATVAPLAVAIRGMVVGQSASEIALIHESARWCEHAHRLLQEYTRPGLDGTVASLKAGPRATLAMLEALGDRFGGQQGSADGASAGYRGQIGLRSSSAHAVAATSSSSRATCWSPRRPRRSGAISPSSSAPSSSGRRATRRSASSSIARRAAGRVRGTAPGRDVHRRRRRGHAVSRGRTTCSRYWRRRTFTRSASATARRRSSTSAITRRSRRGWCSRSSPACMPTSRQFRRSTRSSSRPTASTSSPTTRATSRASRFRLGRDAHQTAYDVPLTQIARHVPGTTERRVAGGRRAGVVVDGRRRRVIGAGGTPCAARDGAGIIGCPRQRAPISSFRWGLRARPARPPARRCRLSGPQTQKPPLCGSFWEGSRAFYVSSSGRTRTYNPPVNSRMLYH